MFNKAEALWQNIIEYGTEREGDFKKSLHLQEGARDEELLLLEEKLGVTLPEEFKGFYRVYNGQVWESGVNPFVRNLTLSSIAEIIENWAFLQEEFEPDDLTPDIEEELKPVLWSSKWIPIAENGAGDYLCIDTDPSESGVVGQILYFWHDWGRRSIEAKSLFEFIDICLKEEQDS